MKKLIIALALTLPFSLPASAQWHRHYGYGGGGAFIGGVIGGIIGNVFRPPYYVPGPGYVPDAVSYCMQRFRSYNPETGFYLGFDGHYHRCP